MTATVSVPLKSVSDTLTARIASKLRTRDQWRNVSLYIDILYREVYIACVTHAEGALAGRLQPLHLAQPAACLH